MKTFFTVFKMDFLGLLKNPVVIFINTAFIFLLTFILGSLNSSSYADGWMPYRYSLIVLIVYTMLNGCTTASNCFLERKVQRANLRVLMSPMRKRPFCLSKITSSAIFNFCCHALVLVAGVLLFHLSAFASNLGWFLLAMAPFEFASCTLGILVCCLLRSEEATSSLLSMIIALLGILGGTFFSFDGMGKALAFLSSLSPLHWLNTAMLALFFDENVQILFPLLGTGILASIILSVGTIKFFREETFLC
ncbi:MAG: ABC transporter permease [Ethanoligenens sp.]